MDLFALRDPGASLRCSNPHCNALYPVIDGVPVVFRYPRAVDLTINPPWDVLELPTRSLLALLQGQTLEDPVPGLVARLARYAWAGFWDRLPAHLQPGIAEVGVHGVDVARWVLDLDDAPFGGQHGVWGVMGAAFAREAWELPGPTVAVEAHLSTVLAALKLFRTGSLEFLMPSSQFAWETVRLEVGRPPPDVRFLCADVVDPPFQAECFSRVLATNLVDSVHDPANLLGQLHALTAPGGLLVVSSPFSWKSDVTPPEHWLERVVPESNGDPIRALEVVLGWYQPSLESISSRRFRWAMRHTSREITVYESHGWCFRKHLEP